MLAPSREGGFEMEHLTVESSSQLAHQVATESLESLPYQRSWSPPGMLPLQQHSDTEYHFNTEYIP